MVPPRSDRIARVPPYSSLILCITRTGLSPAKARRSKRFRLSLDQHWPGPRSLATTNGVSIDVLSSGYLDVSVPRVCLKPSILFKGSYLLLITEIRNLAPTVQRECRLVSETQGLGVPLSKVGFPIQIFADQRLFAPPRNFSQRTTSFVAS